MQRTIDDLVFGPLGRRDEIAKSELKAVSLEARRRTVRELFGEDGVRAVTEAIEDETARKLWSEEKTLTMEWIPIGPFLQIDRAILSALFHDDLDRHMELVAKQAENEVNTIYRFLLRLGGPAFVLKRIGVALETKIRPGTMTLLEKDDRGGLSELTGVVLPPYVCERSAIAWAEMALRLAGAKGVRTEKTACVHRGDESCRYRTTWAA